MCKPPDSGQRPAADQPDTEPDGIKLITERGELAALGEELGVGADWAGELDSDRVDADVGGQDFSDEGIYDPDGFGGDMFVTIWKDGTAVAAVNLLSLFAWAAENREG